MTAKLRRSENEEDSWRVGGVLAVWHIAYIINTRLGHATSTTSPAPIRLPAALSVHFLFDLSLPQSFHPSFPVISPPWFPLSDVRFAILFLFTFSFNPTSPSTTLPATHAYVHPRRDGKAECLPNLGQVELVHVEYLFERVRCI